MDPEELKVRLRLELPKEAEEKGLLDRFCETRLDRIVDKTGVTRKAFGTDAKTTREALKRDLRWLARIPRLPPWP